MIQIMACVVKVPLRFKAMRERDETNIGWGATVGRCGNATAYARINKGLFF